MWFDVAALMIAVFALGFSVWSLLMATQARDIANMMFARGRVAPDLHDDDEVRK